MTGSGSEGKWARRGGRGFRRASESARPALRGAASRYGFAEADVLARWPEVVGEAFSAICRPVKVSYGGSRALGATLVVEADGPRAPEVEMQSPRILERINAFYGYRAVARLRVAQTAAQPVGASGFAEGTAAFRGPGSAPDPAAVDRLRALAAGAKNPALRDALTRLGTYVLAEPRNPKV